MNKLMSSVLEKNSSIDAIVKKVEEEGFLVVNSETSLRVKKAFSCLVEPLVGDKVLLSVSGETISIIAILQREDGLGIDIVAKNDINIVAKDGDITLNTQNSINIFSNEANIVIEDVSYLSKITSFKTTTVNIMASTYQGFIDSVTLRYKELNKFVDGHEEHQSISSRRVIKGSDIHQVNESITLVDGQMKIDATQINMG